MPAVFGKWCFHLSGRSRLLSFCTVEHASGLQQVVFPSFWALEAPVFLRSRTRQWSSEVSSLGSSLGSSGELGLDVVCCSLRAAVARGMGVDTDGAAAPLPAAFETPPSVLRGERSPTDAELGDPRRRTPGVDSTTRRLATQLDELAVDPAQPVECDGGVPLGELHRAADLAPPSPPVAEPPARTRRRLADGQATQGEQAHEPPPAAGSLRRRQRGDRVFCPMAQCPCADSLTAPGWSSIAAMHGHVDMHLARGEVPHDWLTRHRRTRCRVCGLSVAVCR